MWVEKKRAAAAPEEDAKDDKKDKKDKKDDKKSEVDEEIEKGFVKKPEALVWSVVQGDGAESRFQLRCAADPWPGCAQWLGAQKDLRMARPSLQ